VDLVCDEDGVQTDQEGDSQADLHVDVGDTGRDQVLAVPDHVRRCALLCHLFLTSMEMR